ncbi:5-formyltetrahydrofolate cyclo-ligase [Naasia lichenicola]|uniref:5-formyltetrahydrofolate cyclo-ligase n=1 Tax=Naasia lichenicola TaxID=2565933 RepID=A0A4S4FL82_9MICO|nr:5-formyltetrahydrofolate cyclo-ligase [Naasia lichenicola]THG29946.1 5-formyltetrahydrofolate cyclo-ligase [Naasia lichenicola]
MNPEDTATAKRALRGEIRRRRASLTDAQRSAATDGLTRTLIVATPEARPLTVACYLSTADEPNTRPYIAWAIEHDVRVLLPISREDGRLDWVDGRGEGEIPGLFGIAERSGDILGPEALAEIDLFVIPAAAVDRAGMRMGWGRGYFDRTLGALTGQPRVIAVVFDEDLYDAVPREPHDLPVDAAATPSGLHDFGS